MKTCPVCDAEVTELINGMCADCDGLDPSDDDMNRGSDYREPTAMEMYLERESL